MQNSADSSDREPAQVTEVSAINENSKKRSLAIAVAHLDEEYADVKELTPMQKSVCERTFLIHQGDYDKIALTLGVQRRLVVDYVTSQGMKLNDFELIRPDTQGESKKRKLGKNSMKNYNISWLKRVEDAEIHPFFVPCNHSGPCSEENCSCIQNRFFCTKHCVWGAKSRNFFRGCSCKGGKCCTKHVPVLRRSASVIPTCVLRVERAPILRINQLQSSVVAMTTSACIDTAICCWPSL